MNLIWYYNIKLKKVKYLERIFEIGREVCFMMFYLASKKGNTQNGQTT